ncbi:hypothetical protein K470DRAFT_268581 [Piedraia hortae CBS 480.64]|uniref:Uncharacterized protein n=1 Tax=Piedraia hortae CBS 480.64 TaxID=1314780 RepID=A0A6A7C6G6_9PEZI|nr:hypothetical protein K470DRAFT_268581 [Piedraia hortae CBS 480.64]
MAEIIQVMNQAVTPEPIPQDRLAQQQAQPPTGSRPQSKRSLQSEVTESTDDRSVGHRVFGSSSSSSSVSLNLPPFDPRSQRTPPAGSDAARDLEEISHLYDSIGPPPETSNSYTERMTRTLALETAFRRVDRDSFVMAWITRFPRDVLLPFTRRPFTHPRGFVPVPWQDWYVRFEQEKLFGFQWMGERMPRSAQLAIAGPSTADGSGTMAARPSSSPAVAASASVRRRPVVPRPSTAAAMPTAASRIASASASAPASGSGSATGNITGTAAMPTSETPDIPPVLSERFYTVPLTRSLSLPLMGRERLVRRQGIRRLNTLHFPCVRPPFYGRETEE